MVANFTFLLTKKWVIEVGMEEIVLQKDKV